MAQTSATREHLEGSKLWGDDFGPEQVDAWMRDEAEGYAQLGAIDRHTYRYAYHAANRRHLYRHLPNRRFHDVLSLGGAYGDELLPIANQIDGAVIVESSELLRTSDVLGVPLSYRKPGPLGAIVADSASFDLVTCFGVLHHLPNVSFILSELARVLRPGGWALIREPVVSMGDWTKPRAGLTRHERGIPRHLLRNRATQVGLTVRHEAIGMFPLVPWIAARLGREAYNNLSLVLLDHALSTVFRFNLRYHARRWYDKLRPTSVFLVLERSDAS